MERGDSMKEERPQGLRNAIESPISGTVLQSKRPTPLSAGISRGREDGQQALVLPHRLRNRASGRLVMGSKAPRAAPSTAIAADPRYPLGVRQLMILLILVGVGYLVYTQGLPKWEARKQAKESATAEADQARACVNRAEAVTREFSSQIGQFAQPPVNQDLWASMLITISGQMSSADSACSCSADACKTAAAALLDLRRLVNDLDGFVRGAGPPVLDAASTLERINRYLVSARAKVLAG